MHARLVVVLDVVLGTFLATTVDFIGLRWRSSLMVDLAAVLTVKVAGISCRAGASSMVLGRLRLIVDRDSLEVDTPGTCW